MTTDAMRAALDGSRPLPFERDELGRMVREAWVRWALTRPQPKPSWLVPYADLAEPDKEADRQIGEAIARWALIGDAVRNSTLEADALRYRYLRERHSYSYGQDYVEPSPAECGIQWDWQQSKPGEGADIDRLIDKDIARLDEDDRRALASVPVAAEPSRWRSIAEYPVCDVCSEKECDWGPEVVLLEGKHTYVGHKEAGEWLVRDADNPVCWSALNAAPSHFMSLPPAPGQSEDDGRG